MTTPPTHWQFESSVNPEGIQTASLTLLNIAVFESSVNPEGIQTNLMDEYKDLMFESSVNPEGIQTLKRLEKRTHSLRVV